MPHGCEENLTTVETMRLAVELQQFAFKEIESMESPENEGKKPPLLRVQPKAPSLHRCVLQEDTKASMQPRGDEDYVLDTYLQLNTHTDAQSSDKRPMLLEDLLQGLPTENVGVLVLADEDQATWETLIDEDANGENYISDEEDENGEF